MGIKDGIDCCCHHKVWLPHYDSDDDDGLSAPKVCCCCSRICNCSYHSCRHTCRCISMSIQCYTCLVTTLMIVFLIWVITSVMAFTHHEWVETTHSTVSTWLEEHHDATNSTYTFFGYDSKESNNP